MRACVLNIRESQILFPNFDLQLFSPAQNRAKQNFKGLLVLSSLQVHFKRREIFPRVRYKWTGFAVNKINGKPFKALKVA